MAKKALHPKTSPELLKALNKFRAQPTRLNLLNAKENLDIESYKKFCLQVPFALNANKKPIGIFFPNKSENIITHKIYPSRELREEIIWLSNLCLAYKQKLCDFAELRYSCEKQLLYNSFTEALDIIDKINSKIGFSTWSFELRIAIIQHKDGLEAQKTYVSELSKARGDRNDMFDYLIRQYSVKNEPSISEYRFKKIVEKSLESDEIPDSVILSLKYYLLGTIPENIKAQAKLFASLSSSTLIDQYELLISWISKVLINNIADSIDLAKESLRILIDQISDFRLTKLYIIAFNDLPKIKSLPLVPLAIHDAYANNDFSNLDDLEQLLVHDPLSMISLAKMRVIDESAFKSITTSNLSGIIIAALEKVFKNPDISADYTIELGKIISTFHRFGFTDTLDSLWLSEFTSFPLRDNQNSTKQFITSPGALPLNIVRINSTLASQYSEFMLASYTNSAYVDAMFVRRDSGVISHDKSNHSNLSLIQISRCLMEEEKFNEALYLLSQITNNHKIDKRQKDKAIIYCLLHLKKIPELLNAALGLYFEYPQYRTLLPLEKIFNLLKEPGSTDYTHRIERPILIDIYSKFTSRNLDDERFYAFEDFLISNKISRPSELINNFKAIDLKSLCYFFTNICSVTLMERYPEFTSTIDVESERLKLCLFVLENNPDAREQMHQEIQEINRNQVIRDGIKIVEQSKIYVDTNSIITKSKSDLEEKYKRILAYKQANLEFSITDSLDFMIIYKNTSTDDASDIAMIRVPKSEVASAVIEFVHELAASFLSKAEHGLDSYLGMRIRHGKISGQLRGPLLDQKIVTKIDAETSEYLPNNYWIERLRIVPDTNDMQCLSLDEKLKKFSVGYDKIIDHLKLDIIQVKSKDKPQGAFYINTTSQDAFDLYTMVSSELSFDGFSTICFQLFWKKIEECLEFVRGYLDKEIKQQILELFKNLQAELVAEIGNHRIHELSSAIIHAQGQTQHALNQVREWFRLVHPTQTESIPFDCVLDIGLKSAQGISPAFKPTLEKTLPKDLIISGDKLVQFSDIFFIIFENIQKHSNVLPSPKIKIQITSEQDFLRILVENEASSEARSDYRLSILKEVNEKITSDKYHHSLKSEGHSGLLKIRKIISRTTNIKSPLRFGFRDNGWFYVELEVAK